MRCWWWNSSDASLPPGHARLVSWALRPEIRSDGVRAPPSTPPRGGERLRVGQLGKPTADGIAAQARDLGQLRDATSALLPGQQGGHETATPLILDESARGRQFRLKIQRPLGGRPKPLRWRCRFQELVQFCFCSGLPKTRLLRPTASKCTADSPEKTAIRDEDGALTVAAAFCRKRVEVNRTLWTFDGAWRQPCKPSGSVVSGRSRPSLTPSVVRMTLMTGARE
jgi:hypothetical protein